MSDELNDKDLIRSWDELSLEDKLERLWTNQLQLKEVHNNLALNYKTHVDVWVGMVASLNHFMKRLTEATELVDINIAAGIAIGEDDGA